jgi:hypothetical protein
MAIFQLPFFNGAFSWDNHKKLLWWMFVAKAML